MNDIALLRRLLTYNPDTGECTWLERTPDLFTDGKHTAAHNCHAWNARFAGKPAFTATNNKGYKCGKIFCKRYYAHRVAWAIHHETWPEAEIDHINGKPDDNRIANLRDVDARTNHKNMAMPSTNTSGRVGVTWTSPCNKWRARIKANGKDVSLGYFDDFDDACAARKAAEREHFFHENHGRAT